MVKQWDHGRGWSYWPGAFSPGQHHPWHKKKNQQSQNDPSTKDKHAATASVLPAYDDKQAAHAKAATRSREELVRVVSTTSTPNQSLMHAETAERGQKARSTGGQNHGGLSRESRLWEEWQIQVQKFLAKSKRHSPNLEHLDKAQEQARADVRKAAASSSAAAAVPMELCTQEAEAHFANFLAKGPGVREREGIPQGSGSERAPCSYHAGFSKCRAEEMGVLTLSSARAES